MQPAHLGRWKRGLRQLILIVFATACFAHAAFAATMVATDADKDRTVQVKLGDTLELRLKSNPSSGSAWVVHPKSSALLHLIGEARAQPDEPDPDRPVIQVFRFELKRRGDAILLMRYARPRQKPYLGEEQFTLRVVID